MRATKQWGSCSLVLNVDVNVSYILINGIVLRVWLVGQILSFVPAMSFCQIVCKDLSLVIASVE